MKSRHEPKIKEGARPFLEEGEEVLAAFVARPRGWTQSMAGARGLGAAQQSRAYAGAEKAEFQLASPMALALTQRRLLTLGIGSPIGLGIGGEVKQLVSAAPIADVDSIEVQRLALGKVVTLTVRGVPFKLEANALAGAKALAEAFDRARGAV
ncbi:MAG: hypothetical protein M3O77_02595 [Chloroflexota bacterium]|nr:hypothetical protein [Chloroflexota bacterium]